MPRTGGVAGRAHHSKNKTLGVTTAEVLEVDATSCRAPPRRSGARRITNASPIAPKSVLFASLAPVLQPADAENARWRLREIAAPKVPLDVDRRVSPDFVMAPYPSAPWKNDWTTTNRSQSLHGYPLFELPLDVYEWRSSPFDYERDATGRSYPGADYSHAYWLARFLGVINATE